VTAADILLDIFSIRRLFLIMSFIGQCNAVFSALVISWLSQFFSDDSTVKCKCCMCCHCFRGCQHIGSIRKGRQQKAVVFMSSLPLSVFIHIWCNPFPCLVDICIFIVTSQCHVSDSIHIKPIFTVDSSVVDFVEA